MRCVENIKELADEQPYYKYNGLWSRHMETLSFCVVFRMWLYGDDGVEGRLFTYQEVAEYLSGTLNYSSKFADDQFLPTKMT